MTTFNDHVLPVNDALAEADWQRVRSITSSSWAHLALAGLMLVTTVVSRVPFLMQYPFTWDSVLFIRAVFLFNATIHQPQPPGYLFYVSAARLLDGVLHDPHQALVWVSAIASGISVAALYLCVSLLYDRLTGLVAAGLLTSSVTFWFYGEVAYPYTTLAAGEIILFLFALAIRRGLLPGAGGVAAAALAFGLLSGFRQDLLLFMGPVFVVALWGRPLRDWLFALAAGACGVLAWLVPTAALSEGLTKYYGAVSRQSGIVGHDSSVFVNGPAALIENGRALAEFLDPGLSLAVLPIGYYIVRSVIRPQSDELRRLAWVLLWLAPPLLVYTLGHIGDRGYTLSMLPALMVLAARGIVVITRDTLAIVMTVWERIAPFRSPLASRWWVAASVIAPLVIASLLMAKNADIYLREQTLISAAGIRCFDATMEARINIVREQFPPDRTLVFASAYYQHVEHFLPEYPVWFHDPAAGRYGERFIAPGERYLVVFDELVRPEDGTPDVERFILPCNGVPFYVMRIAPGDVLRYDRDTLKLSVQPAGASRLPQQLETLS